MDSPPAGDLCQKNPETEVRSYDYNLTYKNHFYESIIQYRFVNSFRQMITDNDLWDLYMSVLKADFSKSQKRLQADTVSVYEQKIVANPKNKRNIKLGK